MSSILCSLNQYFVRSKRDFGSWLFLLLQRIEDFCVLVPSVPAGFVLATGPVSSFCRRLQPARAHCLVMGYFAKVGPDCDWLSRSKWVV